MNTILPQSYHYQNFLLQEKYCLDIYRFILQMKYIKNFGYLLDQSVMIELEPAGTRFYTNHVHTTSGDRLVQSV